MVVVLERSPYEVLGVESGASQRQIKSAYRRAVRRWHPDVRGGDVDRFREVEEAFRLLGERGWVWEPDMPRWASEFVPPAAGGGMRERAWFERSDADRMSENQSAWARRLRWFGWDEVWWPGKRMILVGLAVAMMLGLRGWWASVWLWLWPGDGWLPVVWFGWGVSLFVGLVVVLLGDRIEMWIMRERWRSGVMMLLLALVWGWEFVWLWGVPGLVLWWRYGWEELAEMDG